MLETSSAAKTVIVYNISETFFDFFERAPNEVLRDRLVAEEQCYCDRALLWLDGPKLIYASHPIPHFDFFCKHFDSGQVKYLCPNKPSPWLSLDIIREPRLIQELVAYTGTQSTVRIIPYATTKQFLQLVDVLRADYGLKVFLPESPCLEDFWLRDYIDTKSGFRSFVSLCLTNAKQLLPLGFVCSNPLNAKEIVQWFLRHGKNCIVKPDKGENGIGSVIFKASQFDISQSVSELDKNSFLYKDLIVVEEYIESTRQIYPSIEVFVPKLGSGEPQITYLSNQVFLEPGNFCGVLISRDLINTPWYFLLAENTLKIAYQLQKMGYVGHFDLDAIVDDNDNILMLEINSRRTGGTHIHELAMLLIGPQYIDEFILLSHESLSTGKISSFEELYKKLKDLIYPIKGVKQGLIITVTSSLVRHKFGCVFVGSTIDEVLSLKQMVVQRLEDTK